MLFEDEEKIVNDEAAEQEDEELPEDFVCPICGVGKDMFVKVD